MIAKPDTGPASPARRRRRQADRREESRERILDAAEGLFAGAGFEAVSMRQIATESGVDTALIHYYFGTKAGVIDAVLERRADMVNARRTASLDAYAREVLATIPDNARVLVTAHDAFSYFGRAYDMEVLGIQGISTESEAGLNRIRALVDTLVERRVGAVFVESSVSDRNMRALIEGAAAQGHEVRIGGELINLSAEEGGLGAVYGGPTMTAEGVTVRVVPAAGNDALRTADLYVAANDEQRKIAGGKWACG